MTYSLTDTHVGYLWERSSLVRWQLYQKGEFI